MGGARMSVARLRFGVHKTAKLALQVFRVVRQFDAQDPYSRSARREKGRHLGRVEPFGLAFQ